MDRRRRQAGGVLVLVLIAVAALAAAGFWNYQRNLEAEQRAASARPMHGYSTSDLEALADAYRQEIAAHSARYASQKTKRVETPDRVYFDQQVQDFEAVQEHSGRVREAGAEVSVREADLARIEEELRARSGVEADLDRQLRLLLTF
jgi:lipopolysaccharide export system protein LptC